jgi:hypothetical protein
MSFLKKILIPAIIIIALIASYFVISGIQKKRDNNTEEPTTTRVEKEKIIDFSSMDANYIEVINDEDTYEFKRPEEGEWDIVSHPELKINAGRINSIAINMSSIMPDKTIEEDAKDISVYGLDKPVTIKVKDKEGKEYTLLIGSKTPTGGAYYIKIPENNIVYTLGSYTTERLLITRNEIKDKTLYTFEEQDPQMLFQQATSLDMKKNGEYFFKSKLENEEWYVNYPIYNKADLTGLGTLTQAISSVSVKEFIEENPSDLGKYNLETPQYEFRLVVEGKTISLKLGKKKDDSSRYAMIDDRDEVFTVDLSVFAMIDKPLKEFIDAFAYIVNIDTATKIIVEIDGKTHVLEIKTNEDDRDLDEFKFNGKDASMTDEDDKQPFRKLYQALIGVTRANIEPDANPTGKVDVRFTYTLNKEPYNMVVEFISKDDFYYYLLRNGEYTGLLIEKLIFDKDTENDKGLRQMLKIMEEFVNK